MRAPKIPCFKCKDRRGGCHAECERYAEYTKAQRAWREANWTERGGSALAYQIDLKIKLRDRTNKEKMRRGK